MNLTSKHRKEIKARLEVMPFKQAREAITTGVFATIGSSIHKFASSWLSGKEAELRDAREAKIMALMRRTNRIAFAAMIIAIIAIITAIILRN